MIYMTDFYMEMAWTVEQRKNYVKDFLLTNCDRLSDGGEIDSSTHRFNIANTDLYIKIYSVVFTVYLSLSTQSGTRLGEEIRLSTSGPYNLVVINTPYFFAIKNKGSSDNTAWFSWALMDNDESVVGVASRGMIPLYLPGGTMLSSDINRGVYNRPEHDGSLLLLPFRYTLRSNTAVMYKHKPKGNIWMCSSGGPEGEADAYYKDEQGRMYLVYKTNSNTYIIGG